MELLKLNKIPLCDITLARNQLMNVQQERFRSCKASTQEEENSEIDTSEDEEWSPNETSEDEEWSSTEEKSPKKKTKEKKKANSMEDTMSDYEKMILMKKERSLAFLKSLKIEEVKESFCEEVQNLKKKSKRLKRSASSTPLPCRKSSRLTNRDVNYAENALPFIRSSSSTSLPFRKSNRLTNKDVDYSEDGFQQGSVDVEKEQVTIKEHMELPKLLKFMEALKGSKKMSNFIDDFSELNYEENKRTNRFPLQFESMKTCESQIAKVVQSSVTAIAIHPVCNKIIISVGSMQGEIGFWNMTSSNSYVFHPHCKNISNLKFSPYDSNQIVSSSYDGGLRCADMEKHIFDEVYKANSGISCTYFDILSQTTFIVAQNNGKVAVVDNRISRKAVVKYHPCHNCIVKSVCIHPLEKNYFISSDNKGAIKLWDLRKLEMKPVLNIGHHTRSVNSAFFSPATGKSILSTSVDNSIRIFDSSCLSTFIPLRKSIRHADNKFFKAIWAPYSDDTFAVGSLLYPRRVEIFKDNGKKICDLMNKDLISISDLQAFHPSLSVLASGNSSGKVFVFTDGV